MTMVVSLIALRTRYAPNTAPPPLSVGVFACVCGSPDLQLPLGSSARCGDASLGSAGLAHPHLPETGIPIAPPELSAPRSSGVSAGLPLSVSSHARVGSSVHQGSGDTSALTAVWAGVYLLSLLPNAISFILREMVFTELVGYLLCLPARPPQQPS